MKHFWKFVRNLLYFLWLIPMLLIVSYCTYTETASVVTDEYHLLNYMTITEADGSEYREEYDYDPAYTTVTIERYENGALVETFSRPMTEDDEIPAWQVLPHPTATAASQTEEKDGSYVTIHWFDADGNTEGYSELIYNSNQRLAQQIDYAADGSVLRTTVMYTLRHTFRELPPNETTAPTE